MTRPIRLFSLAEVAASKAVRDGETVSSAAARFKLTTRGLSYLLGDRFGGIAGLRQSAPSDAELDDLATRAERSTARASTALPEAEDDPRQISPFSFPHSVHREDQLARARDFRRGVGSHRDLTGALLGDPPVGRSALDRRDQGCAA